MMAHARLDWTKELNAFNLCATYNVHMRDNSGSQQISFIEPFGSELDGNMFGTESFPALRVVEKGYFPKQIDGWNCGVGVCATIGIVFRHFLSRNFIYNELFLHSNMSLKRCDRSGELYCEIPILGITNCHFMMIQRKQRKQKAKITSTY